MKATNHTETETIKVTGSNHRSQKHHQPDCRSHLGIGLAELSNTNTHRKHKMKTATTPKMSKPREKISPKAQEFLAHNGFKNMAAFRLAMKGGAN